MILKRALLTFIFISLECADLGLGQEDATCRREQHAVTKIINSLGTKLEGMIESDSNYFFSPLSISVALGMLYIGARGTTREQMSVALDFNAIGKNCLPNKISESYRELIQSLEKEGDDYSFLIANGAFIQTGYEISEYYMANLEKFFNSNLRFLNFAEEETVTMEKINEWVANYTKGKIPKLLNEPLNPMTILVIVNAVYFKGIWDLPFDERSTRKSFFYDVNGTSKTVPFMMADDKFEFYYDEENEYSFLELDYAGRNISMILILPKSLREIPQITLTNKLLCRIRSKFELKSVNVLLPKFSMEFKRELSKDMIKLGMADLFSDTADLTGIREQNDLHVSLMVHKAVIEVNEKGSEASAISGIGIDGRQKVVKKETFWADHPFLFYIVHKQTDTVLFAGRMVNP